jgi:cytochrome P450
MTSFMISFSFIDQKQCFEMGYRELGYMHSLFGDLVLFLDEDDSVTRLRGLIHSLFIPETTQMFMDIVNKSYNHHLPSFEQSNSVAIYDHFKHLTTEMCLSLFLGLDCTTSEEEMRNVAALTVTHWHGN